MGVALSLRAMAWPPNEASYDGALTAEERLAIREQIKAQGDKAAQAIPISLVGTRSFGQAHARAHRRMQRFSLPLTRVLERQLGGALDLAEPMQEVLGPKAIQTTLEETPLWLSFSGHSEDPVAFVGINARLLDLFVGRVFGGDLEWQSVARLGSYAQEENLLAEDSPLSGSQSKRSNDVGGDLDWGAVDVDADFLDKADMDGDDLSPSDVSVLSGELADSETVALQQGQRASRQEHMRSSRLPRVATLLERRIARPLLRSIASVLMDLMHDGDALAVEDFDSSWRFCGDEMPHISPGLTSLCAWTFSLSPSLGALPQGEMDASWQAPSVVLLFSSDMVDRVAGMGPVLHEDSWIEEHLVQAHVRIRALLGNCSISMDEMLSLEVGDMLRLDRGQNDLVTIQIEDENRMLGRPIQRHGTYAVKIEGDIPWAK